MQHPVETLESHLVDRLHKVLRQRRKRRRRRQDSEHRKTRATKQMSCSCSGIDKADKADKANRKVSSSLTGKSAAIPTVALDESFTTAFRIEFVSRSGGSAPDFL